MSLGLQVLQVASLLCGGKIFFVLTIALEGKGICVLMRRGKARFTTL